MSDILLIGAADDPQVRAVGEAIVGEGRSYRLWDSTRWPGEARASISTHPPTFVGPDGAIANAPSVYVRDLSLDPRRDRFRHDLHERPLSLLNQLAEYRGLLISALMLAEEQGTRVFNSAALPPVHSLKPWQMTRFKAAGLPVPDTLATNDPEAIGVFRERHKEVIFKPVAGGAYVKTLEPEMCCPERLERLRNSPVLFQERVRGDNIRLFVCDGVVVAVGRIESEELDYRTGLHNVVRYRASDELTAAAVRAAELSGLRFSGVDAIVSDDQFWILEANPSPMFALFDQLAGTDVAGYLARALVGSSR